mmetsp:Transcript_63565/g.175305  ORF Transcript_63565/g.175305 Transcript_63565/m.175305 type:complete len:268 (+) Transcript_63565:669-1472(+)
MRAIESADDARDASARIEAVCAGLEPSAVGVPHQPAEPEHHHGLEENAAALNGGERNAVAHRERDLAVGAAICQPVEGNDGNQLRLKRLVALAAALTGEVRTAVVHDLAERAVGEPQVSFELASQHLHAPAAQPAPSRLREEVLVVVPDTRPWMEAPSLTWSTPALVDVVTSISVTVHVSGCSERCGETDQRHNHTRVLRYVLRSFRGRGCCHDDARTDLEEHDERPREAHQRRNGDCCCRRHRCDAGARMRLAGRGATRDHPVGQV